MHKPRPSFETLLMRAAVSGWFDPFALLQDIPESDVAEVAGQLSLLCDERSEAPDGTWMLNATARRRALDRLDRAIAVTAALDGAPPVDNDLFGRALRAVLQGVPDGLTGKDANEESNIEAARHAALQFAIHAPVVVPEQQESALEDTRARMAEHREDSELAMVLPGRLFGRTSQLGRILRFAQGQDPDPRPLLVTGIGGVGKSALMAAAVRRWRQLGHVAVVVDFDRPDLTGADPLPVVREFLRRLETAWLGQPRGSRSHEAARSIVEMRDNIRKFENAGASAERQQSFVLSAVISLFRSRIPDEVRSEPLLLIFDSFEVVGVLGPAVVHRLLELADFMRTEGGCAGFRIVVSGRATPLPEEDTTSADGQSFKGAISTFGPLRRRVDVRGLGEKEGADFLAHLDKEGRFPAPSTRRTLSKALHGHPLALKVLERFAQKKAHAEIEALVTDLENEPGFSAEFAQSFIYTRILDRIVDPEVETLAHPGLVLRQVTPDLIRLVLAEPCGLVDVDPIRAKSLLSKLASEYWLVERINNDHLRHRPDLRRLMLPGLFAQPRPQDNVATREKKTRLSSAALSVCKEAARFYEIGPSEYDPAFAAWKLLPERQRVVEGIYYRALAGEAPPPELPQRLAVDVRDMLREDLETLPVGWRAVVRASLEDFAGLSQAELSSLQGPVRDRAVKFVIETKLRTGQGLEAAGQATRETARRAAVQAEAKLKHMAESSSAAPPAHRIASRSIPPSAGEEPTTATPAPEEHLSPSDLSLLELRVRGMYSDAKLEDVYDDAKRVLQQYVLGNISQTTQKELMSGSLWNTGLWESALIAGASTKSPGIDTTKPQLEGRIVPPSVSAVVSLLIGSLMSASAKSWAMTFMSGGNSLDVLRSHDGLRLAAGILHDLPAYPPNYPPRIELSSLAMAEARFMEHLEKIPHDSSAQHVVIAQYNAKEIEALRSGRITLATLEQAYLARLDGYIPDAVLAGGKEERAEFLNRLVGLAPELYEPTGHLMQKLKLAEAAGIAETVARTAKHWPVDLWVEQESGPKAFDAPKVRRPYNPHLAAVIVQTADRCGVLETLLFELAHIDPRAEALFRIYRALASRILYFRPALVTV